MYPARVSQLMQIIPLGINGFFPTFGRHTTSFLLLTNDKALLLDAGTGVSRLVDPKIRNLLQPYDVLHLILSHYHLDHVTGLAYLAGIMRNIRLVIYAPAPPFVTADPHESLTSLIGPPFFSLPLTDFPSRPEIIPINKDQIEIENTTIFVRPQKHPGGSIGVRIADLVFMTDTKVDTEAISFVKGASLLLHEVWVRDKDVATQDEALQAHSFASGVAELAVGGGVHQLMPIHLYPHWTSDDIQSVADEMVRDGVRIVIPSEGEIYDVTASSQAL
jgi:ribonuclease BN (tRNA processing enzyme)